MKLKSGTVLSAFSFAIATVALVVSIMSNNKLERSVEIAEIEFANSRSPVWILDISEDFTARLTSISDEIQIQKAFVYFPPNFAIAALVVRSPDYQLPFFITESAIEIGIDQIESSSIKRNILGIIGAVPVVIESWYAVRGESYRDISLYSLEFHPQIGSDSFDIRISGLSFARRLNSNDNVRNILMEEWNYYLLL